MWWLSTPRTASVKPQPMPSSGTVELLPRLGAAGADLHQRLLGEVQRARRRVGLEVRPGPVALDRVAAVLGDLPLE